MRHTRHRSPQGFTLVEMSIVLAIIGLLIGGILVGTELIRASKLRKVISETDELSMAIRAFKLKYNALPGDLATATAYWSTAYNGDGNGVVANIDLGGGVREALMAWQHLGLAKMIKGDYTGKTASGTQAYIFGPGYTNPGTAYIKRGGYTFSFFDDVSLAVKKHAIQMVGNYEDSVGNPWADAAIYSTTDALALDKKVDDGRPGTGKIMAYSTNNTLGNWTTCHDGSNLETMALKRSATYNSNSSNACRMVFLFE